MNSRRGGPIVTFLACAPLYAATITCTVTDQNGTIVSTSCAGREGTYGYHAEVHAAGSPQYWSVYLDAAFYVNNSNNSPYKTSISLFDYESFSVSMVVTGGSGSAYLWYSGDSYYGSHYDSSWGVKYGDAGGLGAFASAPCYLDWPKDWQNPFNCYVPFTYGVPLTLSGFARVNGHLSGNLENDSWYFHSRGTLMGIVSEPGGQLQAASDDVQIQVLPEPNMAPLFALAALSAFLLRWKQPNPMSWRLAARRLRTGYCAGTNTNDTGEPTSNLCPVDRRRPVLPSMAKTTKLLES